MIMVVTRGDLPPVFLASVTDHEGRWSVPPLLKLRGDLRPGLPASRSLPLHSIFYIFGRSRRDRARNERLGPGPPVGLAAQRARSQRLLALRRFWFRLAPIRRGRADSSR